MWTRHVVAFLVVACLPAAVRAQPLVDRVPDDAIVYIGWQGSQAMPPAYQQSHLKAVLDSSNVPQLFNEFLPRLLQRIGREDRNVAQTLQAIAAVGAPLWRHPSAFYFNGLDVSHPDQPMPRLALLCDAGADAQPLAAQLNALLANAPGNPLSLQVRTCGSLVALTSGQSETLDALLGGQKSLPSLQQNPAFQSAVAQAQAEPVCAFYMDVEALVRNLDQAVAAGHDPNAKAKWPILCQALGLNGIKRVIYTGGFAGQGWSEQLFVAAPSPRTGLACLIDTTPVSRQLLASIPRTATIAGAGQFDLARLLAEVRTAVGKVDLNDQAQFDQALASASQMLGFDLQKELLEALGSDWAYYEDPSIGGNGSMGLVLINRLRNPASAQQALGRLEQFASTASRQALNNAQITLVFQQTNLGDLNIHYLGLPLVAPCWAVKDGNLYIAFYPQVIVEASAFVAAKGASILDNPDFAAMQQRLGSHDASGMQFVDLPRTAPNAYPALLLLSQTVGLGDLFGVPAPSMVLPPLGRLTPHLAPAGMVSWSDPAGWYARTTSPFPGSQALALDLSGAMIQQNAMALGILLPSLNRARQTANHVKSAANMRMIGMAIMLYRHDHNGHYPPDLGTLVTSRQLVAQVFVCPSSPGASPAQLARLTPQQSADWVNQHSDYVYIGQGFANSGNPELIVLYEKPGIAGQDGINLLYADGHVEFQAMAGALAAIQNQTGQPPVEKPQSNLPANGGL